MKTEKVNFPDRKLDYLTEPYSIEELKSVINEDGEITDVVRVNLKDMFNTDFDGFLDIISEKLVGYVTFVDEPSYRLVGSDNEGNLYFEVTGTIEIPEDESEENEQQWSYVKVYCDCATCPSRIGGVCTMGAISLDYEGRCVDGSSY